jgi:hypothetical protein
MKRFLFFEMPKTGSTFHASVLKEKLGNQIEIIGHRQLYSHYKRQIPGVNKDNLWKFCFVRNPLKRFISAYRWLMVPRNISEIDLRERKAIKKYRHFNDFCRNLEEFTQNPDNSPIHFYPQYLWITDDKKNLFFDYIGKFETMDDSWKNITRQLNIEYTPIFRGNKKGFRGIYRHYRKKIYDFMYQKKLSEENIHDICDFYKKDYELFNYSQQQ